MGRLAATLLLILTVAPLASCAANYKEDSIQGLSVYKPYLVVRTTMHNRYLMEKEELGQQSLTFKSGHLEKCSVNADLSLNQIIFLKNRWVGQGTVDLENLLELEGRLLVEKKSITRGFVRYAVNFSLEQTLTLLDRNWNYIKIVGYGFNITCIRRLLELGSLNGYEMDDISGILMELLNDLGNDLSWFGLSANKSKITTWYTKSSHLLKTRENEKISGVYENITNELAFERALLRGGFKEIAPAKKPGKGINGY